MEEIAGKSIAPCYFCVKSSPGRYTCPRCNARYCSTECYKSEAHSACSESFYRDCFMEGLRDMESDPTQRQRVADMLRRLETEDAVNPASEDEEDGNDLDERLAGINLDGPPDEIWERLTENERREFDRFVASGQLTDVIPLWTPWWTSASSKPLIEELPASNATQSTSSRVPPALTRIPDIASLGQKSGISELMPFSIVNVIYGYAYAARLYNGDHAAMAVDTVRVICDISESINRGVFTDAATAIASCLSRLETDDSAKSHFISREYSIAIVQDVIQIISGPSEVQPLEFAIAALSDSHRIFKQAHHELTSISDEAVTKRDCFLAQKKLEFLVSWAMSYGCVLQSLLPALELESCELTTQLAVYQSERDRIEKAIKCRKLPRDKQLITEISSS